MCELCELCELYELCELCELHTLHYWLRPIESGQLRFQNFASHFIFVQIFQIDFSTLLLILSASNYFRY